MDSGSPVSFAPVLNAGQFMFLLFLLTLVNYLHGSVKLKNNRQNNYLCCNAGSGELNGVC